MVQAGENSYLAQETIGEFLLLGKIGQQNFHGFHAVGKRVADFVDLAHSSGAQSAEDEVVAFTCASDVVGHLASAGLRVNDSESAKAADILRHLRQSERACCTGKCHGAVQWYKLAKADSSRGTT